MPTGPAPTMVIGVSSFWSCCRCSMLSRCIQIIIETGGERSQTFRDFAELFNLTDSERQKPGSLAMTAAAHRVSLSWLKESGFGGCISSRARDWHGQSDNHPIPKAVDTVNLLIPALKVSMSRRSSVLTLAVAVSRSKPDRILVIPFLCLSWRSVVVRNGNSRIGS